MKAYVQRSTVLAVAALFAATAAYAGNLRVAPSRVSGQTVEIPILLEGDVGDGVAALSFQLVYDPAVLQPVQVQTGSAASSAGKQVDANVTAPGEYRVLMFAMNQSTVGGGEVATVVMERVGSPEDGRTAVAVTQTALSSAEGIEIPSQGSRSVLSFNGEEQEDEPEDATPEERPAPDKTPERPNVTDNRGANSPERRPESTVSNVPPVTTTGSASVFPPEGPARVAPGEEGAGSAARPAARRPAVDLSRLASAKDAADAARGTVGPDGTVAPAEDTGAGGTHEVEAAEAAAEPVITPEPAETQMAASSAAMAPMVEAPRSEVAGAVTGDETPTARGGLSTGVKAGVLAALAAALIVVFVVRRRVLN